MQRRDFIKIASACGLGVVAPAAAAPRKDALFRDSALYDGVFYVLVNASGGWDPTSLCDPKGTLDSEEGVTSANPMNKSYLQRDIGRVGNLSYAPVGGNAAFFNKYGSELLVINGIDTSTNGHDSGSRHIWSGRLAEGYPSFGALVAGARSKTSPMAYLSNGGFDFTGGLVAPTRSGNTGPLARLAFPNRPDATPSSTARFHADDSEALIRNAQRARLSRQQAKETLTAYSSSFGLLFAARTGEAEVQNLTTHLPTTLDNSNNPLRRQSQVAIAAYKAGLTVAANLNVGGFDTHSNHDQNQITALQRLLEGIDFLMVEAERQGVRDRVVVVVGSDFGRTPGYNDGNGKDHWSITSMMAMGAGIRGNRVIGGSDARHRARGIDRSTLAAVESGGLVLRPEHVHHGLRRLAGIDADPIVTRGFGLVTDELDIF